MRNGQIAHVREKRSVALGPEAFCKGLGDEDEVFYGQVFWAGQIDRGGLDQAAAGLAIDV